MLARDVRLKEALLTFSSHRTPSSHWEKFQISGFFLCLVIHPLLFILISLLERWLSPTLSYVSEKINDFFHDSSTCWELISACWHSYALEQVSGARTKVNWRDRKFFFSLFLPLRPLRYLMIFIYCCTLQLWTSLEACAKLVSLALHLNVRHEISRLMNDH